MVSVRFILAKLLNIPRKLRVHSYIYWNRFVLRLYVGHNNLGPRAKMYSKIYFDINKDAIVTIGEDFEMSSGEAFNPLCRNQRGCIVVERANTILSIGHHTGMSSPCLWAKKSITIGNYVKIGGDCIIMDSDAHSLDWRIRDSGKRFSSKESLDDHSAKCAPITIQDHVLIGAKSIILKGVTIGEGSVIGAGSVVAKDIPAHCIAAGNPAKVIRYIE